MKKILALILALSMMFALVSCFGGNDDDDVTVGPAKTTVENAEEWEAAFDEDLLATAVLEITLDGAGDGNGVSISYVYEVSAQSIYSKVDMSLSLEGGTSVTKVESNITDMALAEVLTSMTGGSGNDSLSELGLDVATLQVFADLFDKATYADGKYTITGTFDEDDDGNVVIDPNGTDSCTIEFTNGKLSKVTIRATEDGDVSVVTFAFSKYGKTGARPVSDEIVTAYTEAKAAVTANVGAYLDGVEIDVSDAQAILAKFSKDDVKCYADTYSAYSMEGYSHAQDMTMIFFKF
jgi:hypothetical protein